MQTAEEVIKDAMYNLGLVSANEPIPADEMQTGIRFLNRMMFGWDSVGYPLGFTTISSPSELVTVPDGALDGVVFNLSIRLAPQYGIQPGQDIILNAKLGLDAVRVISFEIEATQYPSTLPVGSGNYNCGYDNDFYPGNDDEILAEQNGNILLEDNNA